jgi:ADP-ribose pyrophosphatase
MSFEVKHTGKFLEFCVKDGWEYVRRINCKGVAIIVAITPDNQLVLVKQFRKSSGKYIIELPAGLVGDLDSNENEFDAANRELIEETGWSAGKMEILGVFPTSTGVSSDTMNIYKATELIKISSGGGVEEENIEVLTIPMSEVKDFLRHEVNKGNLVDTKVWLYNF